MYIFKLMHVQIIAKFRHNHEVDKAHLTPWVFWAWLEKLALTTCQLFKDSQWLWTFKPGCSRIRAYGIGSRHLRSGAG